MRLIQRFIITIEGAGWNDVEDVELPAPPGVGEPIETKYGTCLVTSAEPQPDGIYDGKIICRLPWPRNQARACLTKSQTTPATPR
jgi:hypothetical protein